MYIIKSVDNASGSSRRKSAQMTKAWKILHRLRQEFADQTDEEILLWLQLCDDAQWKKMADAVGLKPATGYGRPVEKGGTSCWVSRDVKALIYINLRSKGLSRPAARGEDALNPTRRIRK